MILRRRVMVSGDDEIDYSKQYLTIVSLADNNTIKWYSTSSTASYCRYIYVSTDEGTTWSSKRSQNYGATLATLQNGERLLIKYYNSATYGINTSYYNYFTSTQDFNVEGNIMSMTTSSNFDSVTSVGDYAFRGLFCDCSKLKSAENLILPATSVGQYCYYEMFKSCSGMTKGPKVLPAMTLSNYCYYQMFQYCSSLTDTPDLPATTLAQRCYYGMFRSCTNLTIAPSTLPATTLASDCYNSMFEQCKSLTTAPELPATTLASYCYSYMFNDCSSLTYIKCFATNAASNTGAINNWVSGVAATGTFVKVAGAGWPKGTSFMPPRWKIEVDNKYPSPSSFDLGLPSGLLWATVNVGASNPEDYGIYFSWGNEGCVAGNYSFGGNNYGSSNGATLTEDIPAFSDWYDGATINLGSDWRMPTKDEFQELIDNTVSEYGTLNGVNGRYFYKKINGQKVADTYIFLPAAGYYSSTTGTNVGTNGSYWSSSFNNSSSRYNFGFTSTSFACNTESRSYGLTIRPVREVS